jgi:hypothetical protein
VDAGTVSECGEGLGGATEEEDADFFFRRWMDKKFFFPTRILSFAPISFLF